jgi:hypothetical protein
MLDNELSCYRRAVGLQAAAEAEVLIKEEQRAFEAWRDSLETVPTIKALRSKAEAIRAGEFEKAANKLGDGLSKKQLKVGGREGGVWQGQSPGVAGVVASGALDGPKLLAPV